MMFTKWSVSIATGLFLSMGLSAATFEGSLSDQSIKADISISQDSYFLDIGGMHDTEEGSYGYIGAHIEDTDTSEDYPVQIGLGARLLAVDADLNGSDSGIVIGLGGFYRYTLPKANRFSLYGEFYYAPQVLSFENVDDLYQAEVRGEYRTLRNAKVFVRYGLTSIDFSKFDSNHKMNKSFGLGISLDL
ncbi:YfaZ family outer membrane protein [Marinomonas sp. 2405UD68-3]|uniref:YfaZ family outer membrane protein n=1 Tax=Marinomonas sp. 2405UD68-3 TaxID=3391835 RepID=UPI0039C92625